MNINVTNLDLGYTQCEGLNTLSAQSGQKLLSSLQTVIGSLKNNWVGSDATVHINNLITVYEALGALVTDAKALTSAAAYQIVQIQKLRSANGGQGSVGAELDSAAPSCESLPKCGDTTEYFVKPEARNDLQTLSTICNEYESFMNDFNGKKEELFGNWLEGADRDRAKSAFASYEENTGTYKGYLDNAKNQLEIAISNMAQL